MGYSRANVPVLHFDDINGRPLVGGSLFTFVAGTTTPATTYRYKDGHEANENPVPLNERGECVVWLNDDFRYKFILLDPSGNVVWSQDDVTTQGGGGSVEQVQSDWDEENPTSAAFIKNKPDLNNYLEKDGDGKDVTVTFDEASERTNIGTGEKLSILFGKIKKWFTDLKSLAFKDKVDLTQDVSGVMPISNGGTGGVNAGEARTNLDVYSKSETDSLLNGKIVITQTLPATGESGKIYYVGPSGSGSDLYEEYIWDDMNDTWIKTGERSLDLSNYLQKNGDGKDVTVTFTEASTRANIASTESLSTLFGKVKKFFTDLDSVAFSGSYNDLSNKPSIPDDTGLVHKSGAETITGIKTFNNDVSPRQIGSIFSKQSKVFTCSVIKPYAEWSAAEQDDNHFRLWTIDITSIVTVESTHCNIVVKLMGSWYSFQGNGALQKEITFQVYNGNIVFSKEDYVIAQSPCSDEFVISGVVKSGSSYLVQVINRNPTANNYPLRLEIEVFNKNDSILDNVTLTESITDGLPVWAVDLPQVTANGSPVLTEATAATVAKTGSYNDLNDIPLPSNIFDTYGPSTEQLTAADVSNGYKDFTKILQYGEYPNRHNFTFWTNNALAVVSLAKFFGLVGQTSLPATNFTFEVYAGYESNPTKVLIRSVTKTDLTDTDDRGVPIQDLTVEPVWNCTLQGSQFLVLCDRITVRVKWKSTSFGSTSNRIVAYFTVAVMNPSGMTEWPQ